VERGAFDSREKEVTARSATERAAIEESAAEPERGGQWRLDDRVIGVHNVFMRLARPERCALHALERIRIMRESAGASTVRRTGLPDDEGALLDCMAGAPDYERGFVKVLYWYPGSVRGKQQRLGIGATKFNKERNAVLSYFRGQMHGRGFKV
jgi:hypothetical protein